MSADLHAAALAAIAARRALIEAGTAGPWEVAQWPDKSKGWAVEAGMWLVADPQVDADATLIAAMHADYARLLDALEAVLVSLDAPLANGIAGYQIEGWYALVQRTSSHLRAALAPTDGSQA